MKKEKILESFQIMAQNYKKLKGENKFQVLSMVMVGDELKEKVYPNNLDKDKKTIPEEHCEICAHNSVKETSSNITLFTTLIPCDRCVNYLLKKDSKVEKIYFLCDEYLENKKAYKSLGDKVIPIREIIGDDKFTSLSKILLNDYLKWKKKDKLNKQKKKQKKKEKQGSK